MEFNTSGVNNLLEAIMKQAAQDYINAMNNRKIGGIDPNAVRTQIEGFFRSKWFQLLSGGNIDPEACIKVCKERGNYAIWREKKKCNSCKYKKCPHKVSGGNFTLQKVCEKDKKLSQKD